MGGISLKLSCQRQKMNSENEVMMEGTQYSTPQPPVLIRMFTILRSCNFLFNFFFGSSRFFGWGPPPDFKKMPPACMVEINALVKYPYCFLQYYSSCLIAQLSFTLTIYIKNRLNKTKTSISTICLYWLHGAIPGLRSR